MCDDAMKCKINDIKISTDQSKKKKKSNMQEKPCCIYCVINFQISTEGKKVSSEQTGVTVN